MVPSDGSQRIAPVEASPGLGHAVYCIGILSGSVGIVILVGVIETEIIAAGVELEEQPVRVAEAVGDLAVYVIEGVIGRTAERLYQAVEGEGMHSSGAERESRVLIFNRALEMQFLREQTHADRVCKLK